MAFDIADGLGTTNGPAVGDEFAVVVLVRRGQALLAKVDEVGLRPEVGSKPFAQQVSRLDRLAETETAWCQRGHTNGSMLFPTGMPPAVSIPSPRSALVSELFPEEGRRVVAKSIGRYAEPPESASAITPPTPDFPRWHRRTAWTHSASGVLRFERRLVSGSSPAQDAVGVRPPSLVEVVRENARV